MSPETDAESTPTATAADTRRYLVGECVGRGGLGSVYRAWDEHLDRQVAIKRLAVGLPGTASDPATAAARLRREASTLAAFQHPHIVTVHDFGADADGPFVVMEFIEGETLEAVAGRAPLDLESFATLAVQTLGAVEAAHRAGLLHRDLKPANLMLASTPEGDGFTVKVLDFGLAKFTPHPTTQTLDQNQSLLGSIYFMAPEQFHREPLDARTDLYALGAIFYYSLTGRHPFDGETTAQVMAAHLEGRLLRPLTKLRPDVSPALAAWVERLMSRVPADRPASAAAALALARPLLAGVLIPGGARAETGTVPVLLFARGSGAAAAPAVPDSRRWLWPAAMGTLLLASAGFFAARTLLPSRPVLSSESPQAVASAARSGAALAPRLATVPPSLPPATPVASPAPAVPTPTPTATAGEGTTTLEAADVATLRTRLGETVTVTGTPVGVGQSRTGTVFYLNFGSRPHEGLAIVYFVSGGSAVSAEDFRAFIGKPIKARGKLGDFKGDLQLVIQSPADVQVVATP